MKKKSILLVLLSCLMIAGVFFACEKASKISDSTTVDSKSGEFDKWNPNDKFKLKIVNGYRKMIVSGETDLKGVVKFELFENDIRVLNSTVVINWSSFSSVDIVDKYENNMKVEIGNQISTLNVTNMVSYGDQLEFNFNPAGVLAIPETIDNNSVELRVIGTSFAPIVSCSYDDIEMMYGENISEDKLPRRLIMEWILRAILLVELALDSDDDDVDCYAKAKQEGNACASQGRCYYLNDCGATCSECPPPISN